MGRQRPEADPTGCAPDPAAPAFTEADVTDAQRRLAMAAHPSAQGAECQCPEPDALTVAMDTAAAERVAWYRGYGEGLAAADEAAALRAAEATSQRRQVVIAAARGALVGLVFGLGSALRAGIAAEQQGGLS